MTRTAILEHALLLIQTQFPQRGYAKNVDRLEPSTSQLATVPTGFADTLPAQMDCQAANSQQRRQWNGRPSHCLQGSESQARGAQPPVVLLRAIRR